MTIGAVAALVIIAGSIWWRSLQVRKFVPLQSDQVRVALGDSTITADIADTEALREKGLSGRQGLTDAQGMLFIFQDDGQYAFWMKDMLFSIDMIWLSRDKRVVYIAPNAAPETYPSTFAPTEASRYVLEVPDGWAARHHVTIGSQAEF